MPAKAVARGASRKSTKASHVGSSRRESKAASKTSRKASRRAAQGIQHSDRPVRMDPTIHAKKDTRGARSDASGKVRVTTPNVPGYGNDVDEKKYNAMKDILLKVLPNKAPGMTQGEMFEAVAEKAGNTRFPGSTHRWWAKCVQLDLEAKGALVREDTSPLRWHLR